jgi:hypothetical protein
MRQDAPSPPTGLPAAEWQPLLLAQVLGHLPPSITTPTIDPRGGMMALLSAMEANDVTPSRFSTPKKNPILSPLVSCLVHNFSLRIKIQLQ